MKRILIFSLAYYPEVGGAEVSIKEITDRISRDDIAFDMVTLCFDKTLPRVEQIGNVRVYRVAGGRSYIAKVFFPLRAAVAAYRLHKKNTYDAWWGMMTYMAFPVALLRIVGVRPPYALTLQDGDPFQHVFGRWYIRPLRPLLEVGFCHAKVVSVLSTYLSGWAHALGASEIVVVPNGVNVALFSSQQSMVKKREGRVVLVSTSRLVHKNALDDVIRALVYLPPHVIFKNYGFGSDKEELLALARELNVSDRVELLPHPGVPELPKYLHAADIFVRPSRSEGFGISFVEAMAARLPVVATQEGGIADFLFDAKRNPDKEPTGWAVDADSPKQIAAAVQDILENPDTVKAVTENAYKMVQEKYDWDIIAKDMRGKIFARIL